MLDNKDNLKNKQIVNNAFVLEIPVRSTHEE
jgi:hypothetical protein